jgi:hypothetical protein
MVAIYYAYYNFCRVHQTLRVTPAMEAGLADHVWSLEELVGLLERKTAEAQHDAIKEARDCQRSSTRKHFHSTIPELATAD